MQLSPAEILDKASILKVKIGALPNGEKLAPQLSECLTALSRFPQDKVFYYLDELRRANAAQWMANETLFEILGAVENVKSLTIDQLLILANAIKRAHSFNRHRVELKNQITAEFGQGAREEKSYACSL